MIKLFGYDSENNTIKYFILFFLISLMIIINLLNFIVFLAVGFKTPDQLKNKYVDSFNRQMKNLDINKDNYSPNNLNSLKQMHIKKYDTNMSKIHDNMSVLEKMDLEFEGLCSIFFIISIIIICLFTILYIYKKK